MLIAFTLSMPNNNSWNGRWSGEDRVFVRVKSIRSTKTCEKLLAKSNHYYNFGDGWGANVNVCEVNRSEAASLRKKSAGFCGYDWMIDSILTHGDIRIRERQNT